MLILNLMKWNYIVQFQQRYRIYEEKQRQIRAAAAKAKEVAAVGKESSHH